MEGGGEMGSGGRGRRAAAGLDLDWVGGFPVKTKRYLSKNRTVG